EVGMSSRQGYKDMRNNLTMARVFGEHLAAGGRTARETDPRVGAGSTDMGDVSHVVPSIHPFLAVVGEGAAPWPQHRFAAAAASPPPPPPAAPGPRDAQAAAGAAGGAGAARRRARRVVVALSRMAATASPRFAGFERDAPQFFHELAIEMNRDWFEANKSRY